MTTISPPRVPAAAATAADPAARRRFFGITIGLLLVNFDATVLNVALPRIGEDLHSAAAALPWTADAYTVVVSGLLLAAGALADRLGSRRVFRGALITFAVFSVLCALAPNAGTLIAGRALLGVSAAGLMPASLALLRVLYPDPARRVRAVGSWAAVTTLGLSAGPALGGLLLALDSPDAWRLIFLVNPPFALLGFALIRGIGEPERGPRRNVDVAGLLLSVVGLGAASFGLIESGSAGWTNPVVLAAIAVSVLAFGALTLVERRTAAPALPPVLFSLTRVRTALGSALLTNYLWYGLWFLLAIWLQTVRHLSPLETGLFFVPAALPCSMVPPFTARAVNRFGARRVQVTGFTLYALAAALFIAAGSHAALWIYIVGALMFSLAAVQVVPAVTSEISVAAPGRYAATGQGALYAARQAGSALGVAVVSAVGVANLRGAAAALFVGAALALVLITFGGRASQSR
ncbi:MFS transporter [Actinospica sp. MGRD01-02]|uniref:MFS transporter n=1 Tax=Actinospica acidithermotolerans TaxID=2828514 RepID=A0A941ECE2_9ACTN|nr:MFS transporter [Actinospica acidithermotolerans]MBR7828722.1 MFS transporter [Actinospica acidithermotolerans]